jgi:hypothetical protein
MESIGHFSGRNLATTTLGLAKVMKEVESHGQRSNASSLHRRLHTLLIGINSENKQFILDKVAKASVMILSQFDARHLSNLIYSFGLAECITSIEDGRTILDVLALEAMSKLQYFNFQDLSNMLWSYAKLESSNSVLFKAAADLIVGMNDSREFKPQELSNIAWAYAIVGESHTQLFSKFADHILAMKDLSIFIPQDFSNIAWAYATTFQSHPLLFQRLAHAAISRRNDFKPQELSNLLCAYATVAIVDKHLFTSFAPAVKTILGKCNRQSIANIAWSYAVANVNEPVLFDTDFVAALQAKASDFGMEECRQLHQWQLWQVELKSGINLPPALREDCRQAFVSQSYQLSRLQDDVTSVLSSIGMSPEEEVLTLSGYRLDALVKVNGEKIGIEVDGPYHFMNQEPTGSTLLKRRQVSTLDGIHVVSVPYWEWDKLGNDREKKQMYLRANLGLS